MILDVSYTHTHTHARNYLTTHIGIKIDASTTLCISDFSCYFLFVCKTLISETMQKPKQINKHNVCFWTLTEKVKCIIYYALHTWLIQNDNEQIKCNNHFQKSIAVSSPADPDPSSFNFLLLFHSSSTSSSSSSS
jgi:hypothetical protein